jgi:hypothetical protein
MSSRARRSERRRPDRRNLDGQLDRLSDQQRDEVVQRLVRMVDAGLLAS